MTSVEHGQVYSPTFYSRIDAGSKQSAEVVLSYLLPRLKPQSVADFGCGSGAWLSKAGDFGVDRVTGVDGHWASAQYMLRPGEFIQAELHKSDTYAGLALPRCDLTWSLEVAEHLPASLADKFVALLCSTSDIVLFSAAIPRQGGDAHINERWPSYWSDIFRTHDFECVDALRDPLWNDSRIEWWYRQNMLLFCARPLTGKLSQLFPGARVGDPSRRVHPERYNGPLSTLPPQLRLKNQVKARLRALLG